MDDDRRRTLLILARLFDYPGEAWLADLPRVREAAAGLADARRRDALIAFIDGTAAMPPIRCQERYTATFDMSPANSLDLTYHRYGNSESRLRALQGMQATYAAAGFERASGELPDFLPLVLEFLAVAPEAGRNDILRAAAPGLRVLTGHLRDARSPYAALTDEIIGLFDLRDTTAADGDSPRTASTGRTARRSMEKRT